MASDHRKRLGAFGELYASHFLERRGYRVLERNVRFPCGELDLVARDGDDLVFVEVKTRRVSPFALPEDSLTAARRAHLDAAIDAYFDAMGRDHAPYRVEVVAIEVDRGGRVVRCDLIQDIGAR